MNESVIQTNSLQIWIPAIVSLLTMFLNFLFYIFIQPRLTFKATAKDSLKKISVEFLNYLTEIVSYSNFDGVPTQIRKFSLQIHLSFKKGTSDGRLEKLLENIFTETKKRKELTSNKDIEEWGQNFRVLVRELRRNLAKYCGSL